MATQLPIDTPLIYDTKMPCMGPNPYNKNKPTNTCSNQNSPLLISNISSLINFHFLELSNEINQIAIYSNDGIINIKI